MNQLRLSDPGFADSFESAVRRFFSPALAETQTPSLSMRLDVSEKDNAYLVKADIPGVKKEDIDVRIDGNVVEIRAQTQQEKETRGNGDKVLCRERAYGSVSRRFSLDSDVDESKAEAKYADGVLTLQLPKKESAASRKLAIQ